MIFQKTSHWNVQLMIKAIHKLIKPSQNSSKFVFETAQKIFCRRVLKPLEFYNSFA